MSKEVNGNVQGVAALLIFGALAWAWWGWTRPPDPEVVAAAEAAKAVQLAQREAFKVQVERELGDRVSEWQSFEMLESSGGADHRFQVTYRRESPVGLDDAMADTKLIARTAVKALVADGKNPQKANTWIFVHAHQDAGKGETGTDLARSLGKSYYDPSSDTIKYESPNWAR